MARAARPADGARQPPESGYRTGWNSWSERRKPARQQEADPGRPDRQGLVAEATKPFVPVAMRSRRKHANARGGSALLHRPLFSQKLIAEAPTGHGTPCERPPGLGAGDVLTARSRAAVSAEHETGIEQAGRQRRTVSGAETAPVPPNRTSAQSNPMQSVARGTCPQGLHPLRGRDRDDRSDASQASGIADWMKRSEPRSSSS